MAMSVHNNSAALTGTQHLMKATEGLNKTMERLSTGMKINSASDDASGLVTSEYQRSHISGLKGGISNIDRAVAMVQTAESGMQEVNSLLIKLREVAINSANAGTLDSNALAANQSTVTNLIATIDRIADTTKFGTQKLLDGSAGQAGTVTDSAQLTFSGATANSKADTYAVVIATAATKASVRAGTATAATMGQAETLTVNNVQIALDNGMAKADVVTRINSYSDQTNVTASLATVGGADYLTLTQNGYGTANDVVAFSNVAADGGGTGLGTTALENYDDQANAASAGLDVAGTIGGVTATGVGNVLTGAAGSVTDGIAVTVLDAAGAGAAGSVTLTNTGPQFQIGAFAGEMSSVNIASVASTALGMNTTQTNSSGFTSLNTIDVTSAAKASDSIQVIDAAIAEVSTNRGTLGSFQANTLEATQAKMRVELKNLSEAESQIRDTDFESEIAEFTAAQIRQQVATAVLSSANQQPQMILSLLRG